MLNRRWILKAGVTLTGGLLLPNSLSIHRKSTKMGLLADLHHGLAKSAMKRLDQFMKQVDEKKPDLLLQLGDFNYGKTSSKECMNLWNQFSGPRYHVLGNHDMDHHGKKHMIEFWGMPHPYYSFDKGGVHFVVLDRNHLFREGKFIPYEKANFYVDGKYRGFADEKQLDWLKQDLSRTELPCVIFCHQGLGMDKQKHPPETANQPLEKIFREANRNRKTPKVVTCFCGHHHIDRYRFLDRIHYLWVNSASYYWVGSKYGSMADYQEPLFAFVDFFEDGTIAIEGRTSSWASPSPRKRGYPDWQTLNTEIKSRDLKPGANWTPRRG